MERIELLAPAKDLETGTAAINCGADAIYMGASRFGAREAAGNSLQDIEALAHYAHRYWAKVYVTINTLLFDEELDEARRLIYQLYEAGADALIIQDVGILELDLPPLPLFASTQMHNHTAERVAFLEKVGFQRAILARELSLEQISAIRSQTSIELETFIHGALCVCYSGQCSMSYALGGRSGNRGQCAQPCRRLYSLLDGSGNTLLRDRYLLSMRDLNLSAHIEDLLNAGVCSFKIEGRLKDKNYVMNIVANYRQILDQILNQRSARPASSGTCHFDFTPAPQKTFNRSFTSYYLYGRQDNVASNDTPKSMGEPIGKIMHTSHASFTLAEGSPLLHPGDGICFFNSADELCGTRVNAAKENEITPDKIDHLKAGMTIYRNLDLKFINALQNSRTERKIRLHLKLEQIDNNLLLTAQDEDGNTATLSEAAVFSAAEKADKAIETIQRQLQKLGTTNFECSAIDIHLPQAPFIPVSVLNQMRRSIIEKLEQVREQNRPRQFRKPAQAQAQYPQKKLTFLNNVLNQKAAAFYQRHGVEEIEPAAETGLDLHGQRVMTTKYCIRYQFGACFRQANPQKWTEPLRLLDEDGNVFPLHFNCHDCQMDISLDHSKPL